MRQVPFRRLIFFSFPLHRFLPFHLPHGINHLSDFFTLHSSVMASAVTLFLRNLMLCILSARFTTAVTTVSTAAAPPQSTTLQQFQVGPTSWTTRDLNTKCEESLGTGIDFRDCVVLLNKVALLPAYVMSFYDSTIGFTNSPTFPQGDHHNTCAIGLDKLDSTQEFLPLDPEVLRDVMRLIIRSCVVTRQTGGTIAFRGLEIVVTNPAEGLTEGTCLAAPRTPGQSLSQRLLARARRKQQYQSQAGPSTASGSASKITAEGMRGNGSYKRLRVGPAPGSPQGLPADGLPSDEQLLGRLAPGAPRRTPNEGLPSDQELLGRLAPGGPRRTPDQALPPDQQFPNRPGPSPLTRVGRVPDLNLPAEPEYPGMDIGAFHSAGGGRPPRAPLRSPPRTLDRMPSRAPGREFGGQQV